jgi:hypothetical protein
MLLQELISKITIPMREETLEYLINVKEETLEFYKVGKYIKLEEKGFDRKKLSLMKSDAYKAMKEIINEFGEEKYDFGISLFREDIEKLVKKEFDAKEISLIKRIEKKTSDTNVINSNIYENNNQLNATIEFEDGIYKIETIVASGMVQKPHYRTLIKKVMGK